MKKKNLSYSFEKNFLSKNQLFSKVINLTKNKSSKLKEGKKLNLKLFQ